MTLDNVERTDQEIAAGYHEGARVLVKLINILVIVITLFTGVFSYVIWNGRPGDRYFAMSFDGKLIPMMDLGSPSMNMNAMLTWTADAASQIMTFGFNNVNESFM